MKPRRPAPLTMLALLSAPGVAALPGCGGSDRPVVYQVPANASPGETQPGEPLQPKEYKKNSGLPAPPPVNPYDLNRPR